MIRHMLNILIITVLALVVIAAGVQLCRPKDHGTDDMVLYIEQDGKYIPVMTLTDSMDKEHDMYAPGCFDEDIKQNPDKYHLFNHKLNYYKP